VQHGRWSEPRQALQHIELGSNNWCTTRGCRADRQDRTRKATKAHHMSPQTCRTPVGDRHCVTSGVVCVIGVSFIGEQQQQQQQHNASRHPCGNAIEDEQRRPFCRSHQPSIALMQPADTHAGNQLGKGHHGREHIERAHRR